MTSTGNMGTSALAYVPAAAATGTGIAIKIIFHDSVLACEMAAVVGVLTVLGVFIVSAQAQETIRLWIRHRTEHRLAAAEAFEIKRRIRAATWGRRWTMRSAAQIRNNAATYPRPGSNLAEIMRITRQPGPAAPPGRDAASDEQSLAAASGDGIARAPLEIVPPPADPAE
jgi:hypothetical protein